MTNQDPNDRVRDWLLARDPGVVPETLRASAARVSYDVRRPVLARLAERALPTSDVWRWAPRTRLRSWNSVGLAALLGLLVLALIAGVLTIAGAPERPPAPFGPAANGSVAYALHDDIYLADPVTGRSTLLVTGPELDADPVWSPDGSRIAFRRTIPGEDGDRLVVADADGSDLVAITPEPLAKLAGYSFSPDGRSMMFVAGPGVITIASSDGSWIRVLDLGIPVWCVYPGGCDPSFRPPDGAQILFVGGYNRGLYVVDVDGTNLRELVAPYHYEGLIGPRWSPDGSHVAYAAWVSDAAITVRTHIIGADGTGDRVLPAPDDAVWNGLPAWSNDGTRLAIVRGYGPLHERDVMAVVPAATGGRGVETDASVLAERYGVHHFEWAPDDTSLLLTPVDDAGLPGRQVWIDPLTGRASPTPWTTTSKGAWQRLTP